MKNLYLKSTAKGSRDKLLQFLLPIIILIGATAYTLKDMFLLIPRGEGFLWLIKANQTPFWHSLPTSLMGFETSAVLFGTIFTNLFGTHLQMYYWAWIFIKLLINILLFFMVYALTKRILIAFAASFIFAVNYAAQWGMLAWTYTGLLERIITVIFLIPSFLFLHLYLEKLKFRYYLTSILFFFLGIGIGQWGLIFAGAYIAYPLFWFLFKKRTKKEFIKKLVVSFSFLLVTLFFLKMHYTSQAGIGPQYTMSEFLLHPQQYRYLEQIPLQLSRFSQYFALLEGTTTRKPYFKNSPISYFGDVKMGKDATRSVVFCYLIAVLVVYFRVPASRPLLLSMIVGVCSLFLINVYFGRYFSEWQPGPSRYLYLPAIWLSIFWALFLWAVFWKKKGKLFILGFIILGGYFLINYWLFSVSFREQMFSKSSTYLGTKTLFDYIQKINPSLKSNTLIITPWDELGCGEDIFLNDQIGKNTVTFLPEVNNCAPPGGWEGVASKSAQVIRLKYDKNCQCVLEEKIK